MALRTINDAWFSFYNKDGVRIHAKRGETVDVPEGFDLDRGDKAGAFTAVAGEEPAAPEGSYIPEIEADWSTAEFDRWMDSGKPKEILAKLDEVGEEQRAFVAQKLIQSENRRNKDARKGLLKSLSAVASEYADKAVSFDATDDEPELDETEQ